MADNVDDDGGEADGQEETQQLTFHHQVQAYNVRRLKNVKTSNYGCLSVSLNTLSQSFGDGGFTDA